jgi:hypothetical protein
MNQGIETPKVKKVLYESVWVRGCQQRTVTKVYLKDKSVLTFAGNLPRKEAVFNAYYQKGRDAGMTVEEAAVFAGKGAYKP